MRMVEELSLLPRSIGGDTGLAPWETLMCKADADGMHGQLMFECKIATHKAIEENTCQISCQCDVTNTLAQESTNQ